MFEALGTNGLPVSYAPFEGGDEDLSVEHDYFQDENPRVWDEPGTCADFDAETSTIGCQRARHAYRSCIR